MEQMPVSDEEILRGLNAHPKIRRRIASLLAVVEDAGGDLKLADAAEMRLIEEIRRMGQEALQAWAERQVQKTEQEVRQNGPVQREGKKLCWHTTFGDIGVMKPQFRRQTQRIRAFAQSAGVSHRGCSRPLQRVVTDLGADVPFAQAAGRGLVLRMDHGTQYTSEDFINQVKFWDVAPSFAFVAEPQTNGFAERFNRTLKEQVFHGRIFRNLEDVRAAVTEFKDRYNRHWRLEKLGFMSGLHVTPRSPSGV